MDNLCVQNRLPHHFVFKRRRCEHDSGTYGSLHASLIEPTSKFPSQNIIMNMDEIKLCMQQNMLYVRTYAPYVSVYFTRSIK